MSNQNSSITYPNSTLSQHSSVREETIRISEALDEDDGLQLSLSPPAARAPLSSNIDHIAVPHAQSQSTEEGLLLQSSVINLDYPLLPPPPGGPDLPPSATQLGLSQTQSSQLPAGGTKRALADDPSSSSIIQQEKQVRSRRKYDTASSRKDSSVLQPFSWATNSRARICSLGELLQKGIHTITGEVQCKRCEVRYEIGYPLESKFEEIKNYIAKNKATMHDRAPTKWMNPTLPACQMCNQTNCAKPVISQKKRSINWLFLLLGGMLGCCTLEQLKYFCKHTNNHRTGAKDRVLYLTYLGLCKQLAGGDDDSGLFDR